MCYLFSQSTFPSIFKYIQALHTHFTANSLSTQQEKRSLCQAQCSKVHELLYGDTGVHGIPRGSVALMCHPSIKNRDRESFIGLSLPNSARPCQNKELGPQLLRSVVPKELSEYHKLKTGEKFNSCSYEKARLMRSKGAFLGRSF